MLVSMVTFHSFLLWRFWGLILLVRVWLTMILIQDCGREKIRWTLNLVLSTTTEIFFRLTKYS